MGVRMHPPVRLMAICLAACIVLAGLVPFLYWMGNSVGGILVVLGLGGIGGGLVNAFLAKEGFVLAHMETMPNGGRIWRPGFLGNALVGLVAAIVIAGMQSQLGAVVLLRTTPVPDQPTTAFLLTIQGLVGAIVTGVGGARLLTAEVDKNLDRAAKGNLTSSLARLSEE